MQAAGIFRSVGQWLRANSADISSGISGAVSSIPGNIAIGFVALAPLGQSTQGSGVGVALLAAAIGASVFTLACRSRGLLAGGSMSFALIIAGVLEALQMTGVLQPGPAGLPSSLAVIALLTLLTGLCETGLAVSGLGQLVTMMPYPVVSGIRNAVALLLIGVQLGPLLGLERIDGLFRWAHPAALAVSVTTLLLMLRPLKALRPIPPVLIALLAGAAVHHGLAAALAQGRQAGLLGPLLSPPAGGLQHMRSLAEGWAALPALPIWPLASTLLPAALTIAVVSAMETLTGASVMQDATGEHGSSRRDLLALAAANVAVGLCGVTPVTGGTVASMTVWGAGGRGKLAGLVRAAVLLAAVLVGGSIIGLLPTAALAGLVVYTGAQVLDRDVLHLGRAAMNGRRSNQSELIGTLLMVAIVIGVAVTITLAMAVVTGLLLSMTLFVAVASGRVIRRRYTSSLGQSRIARSDAETETLGRYGGEIEVIELQGPLFFGNVDRLAQQIDASRSAGARSVIVDFRRVSQIDLSGARRMMQVATEAWRSDAFLLLAGLRPGTPAWVTYDGLGLCPQLRPDRVFGTLEDALATAERNLLVAHGTPAADSVTPAEVLTRLGIPKNETAAVLAQARECSFPAGQTIVRLNETADACYILLAGELEVLLPADDGGAQARLATLTAGALFGEMGLLPGSLRGADVTAVTRVRCLSLNVSTIAHWRQERPELMFHIMTAVTRQMARNLRMVNSALWAAGQ